VAGMTFTIEPMLTIGKTNDRNWKDGWTAGAYTRPLISST